MLLLAGFSYVIFNARAIFGIGIFNVEDDYVKSYSGGTAGVNLHMLITHYEDNKYYLYTDIDSISTGSVANYGILSIAIHYLNDNSPIYTTTREFDIPLRSYAMNRLYIDIVKYDNITCYGTIELSLEAGGIPVNDTINFQLSYILPMGIEDYHNVELILYVLFFLPFFLPIVVVILLNWIFKPKLGFNYSEEEMKRDEQYLKYLHEHIKEQRKKAVE
jgi:hypothetical protein